MMSTVVKRESDGVLMCYVKGADSAVFNQIKNPGQSEQQLYHQLEGFAIQGLRTLMFASRLVAETEIEKDPLDMVASEFENNL